MKLFRVFVLLLFVFALYACNGENSNVTHEQVFSKLSLTYAEGESKEGVTKDIELTVSEFVGQGVKLEWESSNTAFAKIESNLVKITQPTDENVSVTIKAKVTIGEKVLDKDFTFTILKKVDIIVEDKEAPVITGAKDLTVSVDATVDLLAGVSASDDVDGSVVVTVDDSRLDLSKAGVYEVTYRAVDSSKNEATIKVFVTVEAVVIEDKEAPVITGAKDITVSVGASIDLLVGVTALDYVDGSVVVTVDDSKLDLSKAGVYEVTYSAVDSSKNEATIKVFVTVEAVVVEDEIAPVIKGAKNLTVSVGATVNLLAGITALDDVDGSVVVTVDDSKLDLSKAGVYEVTYSAVDSSDNLSTVRILVTVEETYSADQFTENFSTIPSTGSSYKNGVFVGVNNSAWSFEYMRSDQALDGLALTFGADKTAKLEGIIQGGVTEITLQMKHAFSGDAFREVSVYVNNELVKIIGVDASSVDYVVDGLNVTGEFVFELRNTGGFRVTVDNITFKSKALTEEGIAIQNDIKEFVFPSLIMEESQIEFLSFGSNGSEITYDYALESDPNNLLIDLSTGLISMPTNGQVKVALLVTFTNKTESKSIIVEVTLGEGDPITVSQAVNAAGAVKFSGILSAFVVEGSKIRAFLQDQSKGIEVELSLSELFNLEIGYSYLIKGSVANALVSNVSSIEKKTLGQVTTKPATVESLSTQLSQLVTFNGIVYKDFESGDLSVVVNDGIIVSFNQLDVNPFDGYMLGDSVTLTGIVVKVEGTYKVLVTDEAKAINNGFDKVLFEETVLEGLKLSDYIETQVNLNLLSVDPIFGLAIVWTSSNQAVMNNSGVLVEQDEPISIVLSYSIYDGSDVIYSGTIDVHVTTGIILSAYYSDAQGLTGVTLVETLTSIISRNYKGIGYSSTNAVLEISDKHPSGSGYLGIYDHVSITGYNKEHVWPQSSFSKASPYVSDMHHLRISNSKTNSTRSNYYFNLPIKTTTAWEVGSNRFFPGDLDKGDIARMLMYMAVRYRNDGFKLIVAQSGRTSDLPARTMGNLAVLLDWHLEDPVDAFEINRNNVIYGTQKNRNPFIDHPELFEEVFDVFMAEDKKRLARESHKVERISLEVDLTLEFEMIAVLPQLIIENREFIN